MVGKDPITVHTVFPGLAGAIVGGLTFAAINSYYNRHKINREWYWFPKFNAVVCILTSFVGYYLVKMRLMKTFRIVSISPNAGAVGIKQMPGRRDTNRPPMSVFYSCQRSNSSMNSKEMNTRTSWLPNNGDLRYTEGMALFMTEVLGHTPGFVKQLYYNALCFFFRHWSHSEIEVVTNAPADFDRLVRTAQQATERLPARIVILCHGMGGHQHIHSDLVLRHLAALPGGAGVVLCPNFTEASSGFCLRDERDLVGVPLKESNIGLSFKTDPPEAAIQMREVMLKSRLQQVDEVMKFISCRDERGNTSDGGLAALLFPNDQEKQQQFLEKISSTMSGNKIEVRLIGHSFGAATVIGAAVKNVDGDGTVRVQSVCALDTWMMPLAHVVVEDLEKKKEQQAQAQAQAQTTEQAKNSDALPPLQLIDSEEWDRWKYNKLMEERLMKVYPGTITRDADNAGTDHLTALDFSMMIPTAYSRKRYVQKAVAADSNSEVSHRRKWATKCVMADDRF